MKDDEAISGGVRAGNARRMNPTTRRMEIITYMLGNRLRNSVELCGAFRNTINVCLFVPNS